MKTSSDSLQRFLFDAAPIRGEFVHLDESWRSVLARHDYPLPLRNLLGELMASAVLLAAMLKLQQGSLILQIQGQGPVSLLVVECSGDLQVRATAKWEGELVSSKVAELIGDGRFVITLDQKNGGQMYQGIVALEGETVAEILQNYMLRSEQLETRLWLAADGQQAAGMLLQKLPEQPDGDTDAWNRAVVLAETVRHDELLSLSVPELLHRLYHEEDIRLFDAQPVVFGCSCSRENVVEMLKMIGVDEVDSVLEEQGSIQVCCEFCNQCYVFEEEDIDEVFALPTSEFAMEIQH
ncbi:33 kDa chaperonin [Ferriphaselus amnicola]|uniref:33 kDa chaperonin n=1 Tax=Ferriphaselus amnicola TaxID=1188319 RepID=A0A2Z6GD20_9PROT|nr:Hsp33 family molecular chaperone HslO [Ferriphaselus amnicola]BBE51229.1 33 kDa chaperonin [Ferriphaselus amnicola]